MQVWHWYAFSPSTPVNTPYQNIPCTSMKLLSVKVFIMLTYVHQRCLRLGLRLSKDRYAQSLAFSQRRTEKYKRGDSDQFGISLLEPHLLTTCEPLCFSSWWPQPALRCMTAVSWPGFSRPMEWMVTGELVSLTVSSFWTMGGQ